MPDSPLVIAARQWVVDNYPYNSRHLLRSLERLDELAPGSSEPVRLATLTHDMERAFPGDDSPKMTTLHDPEYERLHSERSARIVGEWLTTQAAPEPLVKEVVRLIVAHESGGWPEADLVQAADSLSFLDTNIDLFLGFARSGRFPVSAVRSKFHYTYERINVVEARTIARPLTDAALGRLADVERELENVGTRDPQQN